MPYKLIPLVAALFVSAPLPAGAQTSARDPARPGSPPQAREGNEAIYGSQMMSAEERAEYRARMRAANSAEERERLREEHHRQMLARAKERGVVLPEAPSASPRAGSGSGAGMGPGSGRGPGGGGGAGQ